MRILIVEDDEQLSELLGRILTEEGHSPVVRGSLREAAQAVAESRFDVIVLDRMLPDGDALELCGELRGRGEEVPILMLTARTEVQDRVSGLRTGADDYLGKPFELDELLARVDALQRRGRGSWLIEEGPLQLDRRARSVVVGGKRVDLTLREYALFERLAIARGEVVTRQALLEDVWNVRFDPGTSVLNVHVSRLRDKLGPFAWLVDTVPNRGYRLKTER
ncbi:MAG: two component transcriptional regulator, winged helix family protein [Polyangiaceae bacterium]|nr:two component transcriptional regulator, winged helix family protein [Polyangiaceae bacterium]